MLPEDFLVCLACFQNCFTVPSFERFVTLMTGLHSRTYYFSIPPFR